MNGTVYAIRCKETGEQYIGSTCKHVEYRLEQHRQNSNKTSSRAIIDRNNFELIILESVICDNKKELLYRERHFVETEPMVVNKSRPIISIEERKKAVTTTIIKETPAITMARVEIIILIVNIIF